MKKTYWLIAIILAGLVAICISCGGSDDDDLITYTIMYEVGGTAQSVDIRFENASGGTTHIDPVAPPWRSQPFTATEGEYVYISAWNNGESGSVTVNILVDYKLWKTSTSNGPYVHAYIGEIL